MNHREPMPLHLFVTGTDTGAGKTVVSLLLLKVLHGRGHMHPLLQTAADPAVFLPSDADSDARFIHNYHEPLRNIAPEHSTGLCFKSPKAPLYAARDEGRGIEAETVLRRLASLRREKAPPRGGRSRRAAGTGNPARHRYRYYRTVGHAARTGGPHGAGAPSTIHSFHWRCSGCGT